MGKLERPSNGNDSEDSDSSEDGSIDLSAFEDPAPPDNLPVSTLQADPLEDPNPRIPISLTEDDANEVDSNVLRPSRNPLIRRQKQNEDIARTICSMVAFGRNRRHNGQQLMKGLLFIACGVTERVSRYLNYVGLSCSRRTAHCGLAALGKEAEKKIKRLFSNTDANIFSPAACIDNLDFQQSIHTKSVADSSTMFHGTWGYIHHLPHTFFNHLNHDELTLAALKLALKKSTNLEVQPRHFAPTVISDRYFKLTLKSQLTSVFLRYVASSSQKNPPLADHPPPVRPIKLEKPNLNMLKLMMASDNSSEGIGDVLSGLNKQAGLDPERFSSRLQIIEGDLGTCMNVLSLCELRIPAAYSKTSLANLISIPGAAHTMWNFAQSIFLHHWGDQTNQQDTGAWRVLKALGIPQEKPVTKRDFTLMISNMEKIHEADLLYCMLVVMGIENETLPEELPSMTSASIQDVVEKTFDQFLSGEALEIAINKKQTKLINLLLRIRDFGTVIEVNRSTKAGDTGRLIFMWKRWAVMGQGLKKLVHYSRHLPQLILLLEVILPKSLANVIKNLMLLCPSGREGHFVATDFYLEVQNFWLKYFYNHSGIGTNIKRLRDVFSINIPVLKSLMQVLNRESGMNVVQQSHKNKIKNVSINSFVRFAKQYNICLDEDKPKDFVPTSISDVYQQGIDAIQEDWID
ncbi:hypothetical protein PGTUg99_000418 [Puccinia graminis f. sp. tritici]|nr:hypothetical protein PGTUg99_000418 [Puccinia graminis f. sp. tritici]